MASRSALGRGDHATLGGCAGLATVRGSRNSTQAMQTDEVHELMPQPLVKGNLVCWRNGDDEIGVVRVAEGGRVGILFDSGEKRIFPADTDALEHLVFAKGASVEIRTTGDRGVVADSGTMRGRYAYTIALANGEESHVLEESVREVRLPPQGA